MSQNSSEAFEDEIELEIGLLDPSIPELGSIWPGYPFPQLQVTGDFEVRSFRTVILENQYLRVTLIPDLGGRIIGVYDKRTSTEILPSKTRLTPLPGGDRGASLGDGIRWILSGKDRLNDLGSVSYQIEVADEELGSASVWIAEAFTGTGLSFHVKVSLRPDRAEIVVEFRTLNRSLRPELYNAGCFISLGVGELIGSTYFSGERNAGIAFFSETPLERSNVVDGIWQICRFADDNTLSARQVDSFELVLIPFSGTGGITSVSREGGAFVDSGTLRIQSVSQRLGHKLLMLNSDGQTLEASVDLYPENITELSIEGLDPVALVVKDAAKQEVTRIDLSIADANDELCPARHYNGTKLTIESSDRTLRQGTFDVATRHQAHTLLGMKALAEHRFTDADRSFEQALMYNADDPLLWWVKAMTLRLGGLENEAELLNAHYLAPLEPALRAEGFLSQPVNADPATSPLIGSVAQHPEDLIEVSCLLIECGLFDQASRWIDESLRHVDLPMLHMLWAYCYLQGPNLAAEAARHVGLASAVPMAPPFPYRDIESRALIVLHDAFPKEERVSHLLKLANRQ